MSGWGDTCLSLRLTAMKDLGSLTLRSLVSKGPISTGKGGTHVSNLALRVSITSFQS